MKKYWGNFKEMRLPFEMFIPWYFLLMVDRYTPPDFIDDKSTLVEVMAPNAIRQQATI